MPPALVLLFQDASQKQRIREEIRRADQLAFLGGMAARVAHEIRTPLATIRGLMELLQVDLPPAQAQDEYMRRILQAVDRQDKLVENLLTLSNPVPELWQPVSVPAVIDDVLGMLPPDARLRLVHEPNGCRAGGVGGRLPAERGLRQPDPECASGDAARWPGGGGGGGK
jgi:signal transduction histidine kinase